MKKIVLLYCLFVASLNATPSCPTPDELVTVKRSGTGIAYIETNDNGEKYYWVFQGTLNENPEFWNKIPLNNNFNNNDHISAINNIIDNIVSGNKTYTSKSFGYILIIPWYITEKGKLSKVTLEASKENYCKYQIQNDVNSYLFGIKLYQEKRHSFFYLKIYREDEFLKSARCKNR